ncbi:triacylglycerol lipase [Bacillus sp. Marseille-Q3570]|uniref:esterase/lipase family protein n=1 Tax=Bacillus sp. Marseille-Q3570 TaxID=2963522 RepID=UPI0021B8328A|nr:alpha/beta fold hydrolase [Bacillus sp. Marseille-Q3570]
MYKIVFSILLFAAIAALDHHQAKAISDSGFLLEEGPPPPGANDPNCKSSTEHPEPVVLVPGTFETMERNFINLSPALKEKGYCVFALNYGFSTAGPSTGPIEESAEELKIFIEKVLDLTGAEKVSIVGHSQGGMMPRYFMKFLVEGEKVEDLIGLVPSNHGTDGLAGFRELTETGSDLSSCIACQQQLQGSDFLTNLNMDDETPGDTSYTVVTTRNDEVVVPYSSAFLNGAAAMVSNITIQDHYPYDQVDHQFIAQDPLAFNFVFDALEHAGPADPERVTTSE